MTSHDRGSTSAPTSDEGPRSSHVRTTKPRKHLPLWLETILLLGIALVLAVVIKTFFIQAFYIPSESMEPGLIKNDRILIQKVSYWGDGEPQRGDVVVFKDPGGWLAAVDTAGPTNPVAKVMSKIGLYPTGGHLVKRVIGVGGDTIECCDAEGRLLVNGEPLDSSEYVLGNTTCDGPRVNGCGRNWKTGPIPEGHVFVMGDNRDNSEDSSAHMCRPAQETDCVPGGEFVSNDLVVGRVFVLLWPADRFTWVTRPDAFEDLSDPS